MSKRDEVVKCAKGFLGCKEADGSHKQIIDIYNSHTPRARGYKAKYTDAWCAGFVSAVSIQCGLTDIMPTEIGCERMIDLYKGLGRWEEHDYIVPQPGDVIFYDWQDSGVGDNTGFSDHVGIVCEVKGYKMKVIEGNLSDAVGYRNLEVNARYIRGYGLPDYEGTGSKPVDTKPGSSQAETKPADDKAKPANSTTNGVEVEDMKTLRRGDKNIYVAMMQAALAYKGYSLGSYGIDSSFGPATETAVKKFQELNGLEVDGICGPKTWTKLVKG